MLSAFGEGGSPPDPLWWLNSTRLLATWGSFLKAFEQRGLVTARFVRRRDDQEMKTLIYGHIETLRKKAKLHINKENWEQTYVLNDTLLNCQPTPEKVAGNQNVELGTLIRPWIWTILFPGFCNIFNIKKLRGQKIWKSFPAGVMTIMNKCGTSLLP